MESCLAAHNRLREQHGCAPLEWSDKCAKHAWKQAEACSKDGEAFYGHASKHDEGQNIYECQAPNETVEDAVRAWYAEGRDYDWPGHTSDARHFSQMLWRATTKVGAGVSADGKYICANYDVEADTTPKQRKKNLFRSPEEAVQAAHQRPAEANVTAHTPSPKVTIKQAVHKDPPKAAATVVSVKKVTPQEPTADPTKEETKQKKKKGEEKPKSADSIAPTQGEQAQKQDDTVAPQSEGNITQAFAFVPPFVAMVERRAAFRKLLEEETAAAEAAAIEEVLQLDELDSKSLIGMFEEFDETDSGLCPRAGLVRMLEVLQERHPQAGALAERLKKGDGHMVFKEEFSINVHQCFDKK
eukprot:TRINITY_DN14811_c0_g1_i1.p1 TRINITY_DN14811_c0_g1~~TRINITY_DN14811_c0_g1_i1.p1  ORF type:complete len:356 (-),score=93.92 TRINITY_DN14811_c0_g1_i1:41-1108(-)